MEWSQVHSDKFFLLPLFLLPLKRKILHAAFIRVSVYAEAAAHPSQFRVLL